MNSKTEKPDWEKNISETEVRLHIVIKTIGQIVCIPFSEEINNMENTQIIGAYIRRENPTNFINKHLIIIQKPFYKTRNRTRIRAILLYFLKSYGSDICNFPIVAPCINEK